MIKWKVSILTLTPALFLALTNDRTEAIEHKVDKVFFKKISRLCLYSHFSESSIRPSIFFY